MNVHEALLENNSVRIYLGQVSKVSRSEQPAVTDYVNNTLSPMEIIFDVGNILTGARAAPLDQTNEVVEGDFVVIFSMEHIYNTTYYYHAIRKLGYSNKTISMKYGKSIIEFSPVDETNTDLIVSDGSSLIVLTPNSERINIKSGFGGIKLDSSEGLIDIKNEEKSLHGIMSDFLDALITLKVTTPNGPGTISIESNKKLMEIKTDFLELLGDVQDTNHFPYKRLTVEMMSKATSLTIVQTELSEESSELGYNLTLSTSSGLLNIEAEPLTEEDDLEVYDIGNAPILDIESTIECGNVKVAAPPEDLIIAMRTWGIITPLERAHFLSQCSHESGNFYYTKELWGPSPAQSRYDNHKYLGNKLPGDGKRYMGRGFIQLTGLANYTQFNKGINDNVISQPSLVETTYRSDVACWFWMTRKLNKYAIDDSDSSILKITKRINGGTNGLDDRTKKFCAYWKKINEDNTLYS